MGLLFLLKIRGCGFAEDRVGSGFVRSTKKQRDLGLLFLLKIRGRGFVEDRVGSLLLREFLPCLFQYGTRV